MNRSRSFVRGADSFRRDRSASRSSGKTFLIVTEGKTEANYMLALRDRLQLTVADVEIVDPIGNDPLTLTRKAIELRDTRKKQARKQPDIVEYDEVWVICDLEEPNHVYRSKLKEARKLKGTENIRFAHSDPCFEYWLLLHEEYTTRQFRDCDSVGEYFSKLHATEYHKGNWKPAREFLDKLPTAVKHAERCRKHHSDSGGGDSNPSTEVDRLARSLNQATRRHYQFPITPAAS